MASFRELQDELEKLYPNYEIIFRNSFAQTDTHCVYRFRPVENSGFHSSWLVLNRNFINDHAVEEIIDSLGPLGNRITDRIRPYILYNGEQGIQSLSFEETREIFPGLI